MLPRKYFDRFERYLLALPPKTGNRKYAKRDLINQRFHLFSDRGVDAYYVPFHHTNPQAAVALVGLTPGWTQMEEAFRAATNGIRQGIKGGALFRHIDSSGSFAGPMRKNLVQMLNGIGLDEFLGVKSCDDLFDSGHALVHFTSVVSAALFKDGRNYGGRGPPLLMVPKLQNWVTTNLAKELASLPRAIIIPLGMIAGEAVQYLRSRNQIKADRCLEGFPHPSGANGHRKKHFELRKRHWRK